MKNTKITPYQPAYKESFKRLNYAWLEKYFAVEPIDEQILSHPEEEIIHKGGHILYLWYEEKVVGTVALIPLEGHTYELSKMAVSEEYQGKGLGKQLMEAALQHAKSIHARRVILYSNTLLEPAIALYRKVGFVEIPIRHNHYQRCNIMMEKVME